LDEPGVLGGFWGVLGCFAGASPVGGLGVVVASLMDVVVLYGLGLTVEDFTLDVFGSLTAMEDVGLA
jgi:hypothetical protein